MSASASDNPANQLNACPSSSASSTSSTSATSGASSITTNTSTTSSSANWTRPTIIQGLCAASSGSSPIVTPPHSLSVVANSPPASPVVPQSPEGKWKKYRKSCCSLNRYTAIAALIIAVLVAYPSFKSWEISKWTARKDFFLYCRENISSLRGGELQSCKAAIDAGLPAPPRLLARHIGQVVQVSQTSSTGIKGPFDLNDRMSIHGSNQSLVTVTLISSQNTPEPPKSISGTIAILVSTFSVYCCVVTLAAYAIQYHQSVMLKWNWVQLVRHVKTVNWTAVFWVCFGIGVAAPAVIFVTGYAFLLHEQASALQVYLEYCKTLKNDDEGYGQCSVALRKSESVEEGGLNMVEIVAEIVAGVVGLAVSFCSMALALFSVWRRGIRKRSNGYKKVQSCEIDLENTADIPLVSLDIHADREIDRSNRIEVV